MIPLVSTTPRVAFVDGRETSEISVWELGVLLGRGAFETMRSAGAGVRALPLHLARLSASLATMGLGQVDTAALALDVGRARAAVDGDVLLRAIVAHGATGLVRIVVAERHDFATLPPVSAATVEARRGTPRAKLTSYGDSWRAIAEANARGASEALLTEEGAVGEGATSNVFATDGDTLVTAPDDGTILAGVTRHLALEAARTLGIPVSLRRPSVELLRRRGGFLTSTKRGVAALSTVDGAAVPVSLLVARIADEYARALNSP